jgi:hypothetical protein
MVFIEIIIIYFKKRITHMSVWQKVKFLNVVVYGIYIYH